jgi:hypothetical protein
MLVKHIVCRKQYRLYDFGLRQARLCALDVFTSLILEMPLHGRNINKLSVEISTDLINTTEQHFNNAFTVALRVDFIHYLTVIQHSKTLRFVHWLILGPADGLRILTLILLTWRIW